MQMKFNVVFLVARWCISARLFAVRFQKIGSSELGGEKLSLHNFSVLKRDNDREIILVWLQSKIEKALMV